MAKSISELEHATRLLEKGYQKAASAFSQMARQQITCTPLKLKISGTCNENLCYLRNDSMVIMISTSIIGELAGTSYLIMSIEEANEIYKGCMPYNEDAGSREMETEALLKELDNILSASVITEISNAMDVMIYGDVPNYAQSNQQAVKKSFTELFNYNESQQFLIAEANFVFANDSRLAPQFIWSFSDGFITALKRAEYQHQNPR